MSALRWALLAVQCLALQLRRVRSVRLGYAAELQALQALQTCFASGARGVRHTAALP